MQGSGGSLTVPAERNPLAAQVLRFPTQTNLSGWNFSLLILHGKEDLNLFRLGWDFIFHLGLARLDFHDLKVALVHLGEPVCPCLLWRSVPCTVPQTVPIPAVATNVLLSGAVWYNISWSPVAIVHTPLWVKCSFVSGGFRLLNPPRCSVSPPRMPGRCAANSCWIVPHGWKRTVGFEKTMEEFILQVGECNFETRSF